MAIRIEVLDEHVCQFLEKYGDAIVVNLGAGLDNRFSHSDSGRIRWYDLDMPDTIGLRQEFFEETD